MADMVKKDSGLPALQLPQLPDIFTRLMPSQTPELTFDKGLIRGWYHGKKLEQMARVSEHEATIAENRARATRATDESLMTALTFGRRFQINMAHYDHVEKMMDLARKKEEALTAQEVYRAKILEIDFKDAELTYKLKLKELGDDNQDEDRE